jgi:hypothetical protein
MIMEQVPLGDDSRCRFSRLTDAVRTGTNLQVPFNLNIYGAIFVSSLFLVSLLNQHHTPRSFSFLCLWLWHQRLRYHGQYKLPFGAAGRIGNP